MLVAAPFISHEVAKALANAASASQAQDLRLLTALTGRAVTAGVLDPEALRTLLNHGFAIRSIQNLHAKLSLVDARWGLVGSGNLTTRGLGAKGNGNIELGVELDERQVADARKIFRRWWRAAASVAPEDLGAYEGLPRAPRSRAQQGPAHGPVLPVSAGSSLASARRRTRTGLWLKALYHDTRRDRGAWWSKVTWISDGRPPKDPTNPKGGPTYVQGDLLVFYLVDRNGPIRCCPAIAEVTDEPRYDPGYVLSHGAPGDAEQWPWVTKVRVLHHTTLGLAPTLATIGVGAQSVRQQGHIILDESQFLVARAHIV